MFRISFVLGLVVSLTVWLTHLVERHLRDDVELKRVYEAAMLKEQLESLRHDHAMLNESLQRTALRLDDMLNDQSISEELLDPIGQSLSLIEDQINYIFNQIETENSRFGNRLMFPRGIRSGMLKVLSIKEQIANLVMKLVEINLKMSGVDLDSEDQEEDSVAV